MKEIFDFHRA